MVDANRLVVDMSELLGRTLGEAIRIETVLAGDLWMVHADPVQIESALVNLAVNARDAMPDGGQLIIETANIELDERYAVAHDEVTAGPYVMISISDTGSGMPADVVERAFEPFFTTKGVGRGTGLGLSQVFGFVKQSRGHLKIYSEMGRGTTVKIYLPRQTGLTAEEEATAAAKNGQPSIPPGKPGEVILVVEDEPRVRLMSVEALRELGYTVVHAENARQALDKFASHPRIDLLFTDVVMPDMTGRELAEQAAGTSTRRSRCSTPPAIPATPSSTAGWWIRMWFSSPSPFRSTRSPGRCAPCSTTFDRQRKASTDVRGVIVITPSSISIRPRRAISVWPSSV